VTVHVGVEEGKGEVWEGGWVSQQTVLKKRKLGFQNPQRCQRLGNGQEEAAAAAAEAWEAGEEEDSKRALEE
jgi:hypothetical protein